MMACTGVESCSSKSPGTTPYWRGGSELGSSSKSFSIFILLTLHSSLLCTRARVDEMISCIP